MTNQKIEQLLTKLANEVEKVQLDEVTIRRIREFESQVEPYLGAKIDTNTKHTLIDQAKQLEIEFAQRHPVAEGILRELVDTLGKMGI